MQLASHVFDNHILSKGSFIGHWCQWKNDNKTDTNPLTNVTDPVWFVSDPNGFGCVVDQALYYDE